WRAAKPKIEPSAACRETARRTKNRYGLKALCAWGDGKTNSQLMDVILMVHCNRLMLRRTTTHSPQPAGSTDMPFGEEAMKNHCAYCQHLASRRSPQAQELVGLSLVGQFERRPLLRRKIVRLAASHHRARRRAHETISSSLRSVCGGCAKSAQSAVASMQNVKTRGDHCSFS